MSEPQEIPPVSQNSSKVSQDQIHDLLFAEKLSWQAIIYDLINTEQLDPWDINISLLTEKYLEKIHELETSFFVSSKVLLAASLLLRIKSEILLNRDIPSLDDILFGKKEEKKYEQERIELDDDIPDLIPRTPLPRFKKVTLDELMSALGKAISTENRRIKKEIVFRQQERETNIAIPKKTVNIQDKIRDVYAKLKTIFSNNEDKLAFSALEHKSKDEMILSFVSLLHLDHQQKIWLTQENHLEEIWIWLKSLYEKNNRKIIDEINEKLESLPSEDKKIETGFTNEIEKEIE